MRTCRRFITAPSKGDYSIPKRIIHKAKTEQPVAQADAASGHDDSKQGKQGLKGEAGAGRKWHQPDGRRASEHVGARAEPAPAWPDQGGDPAAQAAAAHAQEPRLRRQLPGEARHAERGAGEAKGSSAAGGGQAGGGERRHEGGAGRAALQVRGAAELRQDCGAQPRRLRPRAPRPR